MPDQTTMLEHQFDDLEQQHEASSLGMWVFLATEVLFFGGMFAGYAVYRALYSDAFGEASRHLDAVLGSVNTAVLLTSSLTMALAVHAAQIGARRAIALFIALTILLGGVFLVIKFVEYEHKYEEGLIPGAGFRMKGEHANNAQLFFSFYFAMTGMHALHMVIGIVMLTVMAVAALKGKFTEMYSWPVEIAGLYWHFVDIVWVFLFPLLYLIDRS